MMLTRQCLDRTMEKRGVLQPTLAWHFLPATRKLMHVTDDRKPLRRGSVLHHKWPLVACEAGLHASTDPLIALQYSPGCIICRVLVWGQYVERYGKLCCEHRKLLAWADATAALRLFAADCAARMLRIEEMDNKVDKRAWGAVRAARAFARGRISTVQLDAAHKAARYPPFIIAGISIAGSAAAAPLANHAAAILSESLSDWHRKRLLRYIKALLPPDAALVSRRPQRR
jgi:hypothetical protein